MCATKPCTIRIEDNQGFCFHQIKITKQTNKQKCIITIAQSQGSVDTRQDSEMSTTGDIKVAGKVPASRMGVDCVGPKG